MKKAACAKFFALAIVVVSVGGRAEARAPSHQNSDVAHATNRGTLHSARNTLRAANSLSHGSRLSNQDMRAFASASQAYSFESRGVGSFNNTRGHLRPVSWQTGRRLGNASLTGHSGGHTGYSNGGGGLQCVTFARADSGIEITGNANTWWNSAAGIYQRGNRPEPGSVLNFRSNGAMRMGHVAVVNQVVDGRTLIIDHANWGGPGATRGGVSRNISVVDVSPDNDWSAVRVALGHSGDYGSIYPTFGFIYNRPDQGTILASASTGTTLPAMNPAPRDLRPHDVAYDEVAEAPDSAMPVFAHHRVSHRRHGMQIVSHRGIHRHGN